MSATTAFTATAFTATVAAAPAAPALDPIELLLKYGLGEHALQTTEKILALDSENEPALVKRKDIAIAIGRRDEAIAALLRLAGVAERLQVPVADLKRLNPELLRDFTPSQVGEYALRVPDTVDEAALAGLERIPPAKIWQAGVPNTTLLDVIRFNTRVPQRMMGDVQAQIALQCSVWATSRAATAIASAEVGLGSSPRCAIPTPRTTSAASPHWPRRSRSNSVGNPSARPGCG